MAVETFGSDQPTVVAQPIQGGVAAAPGSRNSAYARGVAANVAGLFHNNRAESIYFVGWLAFSSSTIPLHYSSGAKGAYMYALLIAVGLFLAWFGANANKDWLIAGGLGLAVCCLWAAFAVTVGPSFSAGGYMLFVTWWLILAALYADVIRRVLDVKYAPPVVYQPAAQPVVEMPADPFQEWPAMRGGRYIGPARRTETGTAQRVELPTAAKVSKMVKCTEEWANVFKVGVEDVEVLPVVGNAHLVDVVVHSEDALAVSARWPMADVTVTDIRKPFPLLSLRSGGFASFTLNGHMLVGGASDSGKSDFLAKLVIMAALDPQCHLYIIDPKRADWPMFRHACQMYANNDYGQILQVLRHIVEELPRRQDICEKHNVRRIQDIPADENGQRIVPTIIVFIDELAHLTVDAPDNVKDEIMEHYAAILREGRSSEVYFVNATQRPSGNTIPTDSRGQYKYAFALRVREKVTTKMILGDTAGAIDASKIPLDRPGVGWLSSDAGIVMGRSCFTPDDEVYRMARLAPAVHETDAPRLASVKPLTAVQRITFPDGTPIKAGWQVEVWEALATNTCTAEKLRKLVPSAPTEKPLRDLLRVWEANGWLTPVRAGKGVAWTRADDEQEDAA